VLVQSLEPDARSGVGSVMARDEEPPVAMVHVRKARYDEVTLAD
jgi:hypothetical protein